VIRPCVSKKFRLQDIVGAAVGREMGAGPRKGVDADTAPGGLSKIPSLAGIMPEGREIEEI
jgi:hypothetical protein